MPIMQSLRVFWFLLFPGVIIHELGHYVFSLLAGVRVYRVKLFSLQGPAYVVHERPRSTLAAVLISIAPFFVGAFLGVQFLLFSQTAQSQAMKYLFWWLGFSTLYYAFPSDHDAENAYNSLSRSFDRKMNARTGAITKAFWTVYAVIVFVPTIALVWTLKIFHNSEVLKFLFAAGIFAFFLG
ncbi:MAG: M50 family metallopeptidase [Candidatus Diapherotrites archaeon]|nr:M50 family metallopeptidase [Candidatus Diapherotrites archaeon]